MAGRAKRIDLKDVPGATENGVKWLMCSGVRTVADAKKAAKAFISDLTKVKSHRHPKDD